VGAHECGGGKHQRIGAQIPNGGKGVVKLALIADLEDMNLLAERACGITTAILR
jgi:hypothetical protein